MPTQTSSYIDVLLSVHHDLWDRKPTISYIAGDYPVETSPTLSTSKAVVPGKSGKDIIFATQDLDKSTYGTMEILRAQRKGKCVRITWIVDPSEGFYRLVGLIKTSPDLTIIEKYTPLGDTITLHSTNTITNPITRK